MCSFRNGNLANSFECYNDIQLKRAFRRFFADTRLTGKFYIVERKRV